MYISLVGRDIENANHRVIVIGFVHLFICICHLSMQICLFYRVSHFHVIA